MSIRVIFDRKLYRELFESCKLNSRYEFYSFSFVNSLELTNFIQNVRLTNIMYFETLLVNTS